MGQYLVVHDPCLELKWEVQEVVVPERALRGILIMLEYIKKNFIMM